MFVWLDVCLSRHLFLDIVLDVCLTWCLSDSMLVWLDVCLTRCLSDSMFVRYSMFVWLDVCLRTLKSGYGYRSYATHSLRWIKTKTSWDINLNEFSIDWSWQFQIFAYFISGYYEVEVLMAHDPIKWLKIINVQIILSFMFKYVFYYADVPWFF